MTFKEFMKQPNPHLDKLSAEAEEKRTADEESAYEERISATEIIDAFLTVTERQLEDYIYNVFKRKGQREAMRVYSKIYRTDIMYASMAVRSIIQEKIEMGE